VVDRLPAENRLVGRIDALRRQDHREHHTGQHLLSQAFQRILGARTIGFHLSPAGVDIDLETAGLPDADLEAVESLANQVVRENRPVRIQYARTEEDRARFDLRGEPSRDGELRIIVIDQFDTTPCGGTHCLATGEIGLIKIRKWERVGSRTRVHFLCGGRAVADYAVKNRLVVELARAFTVEESALADAIARQGVEAAQLRKEHRAQRREIAQRDAQTLLAGAQLEGSARIVLARRDGSPADELSFLTAFLKREPGTVVLLGGVEAGTARVAFSRSEDLRIDLRPALAAALAPIGGSGGGRPDSVQGAGPSVEGLDRALAEARRVLAELLAGRA
jgi:alanyl-tRNA synthetase